LKAVGLGTGAAREGDDLGSAGGDDAALEGDALGIGAAGGKEGAVCVAVCSASACSGAAFGSATGFGTSDFGAAGDDPRKLEDMANCLATFSASVGFAENSVAQ